MTRIFILILVGFMALATLSACADGEESGEHAGQSESGEHSGEEGSDSDEDGEESGTQYGLTDTYDEVRAGARLIVSYDDSWNTFRGTVENTAGETLRRVRVEIHLSNGAELGPTTPLDLAPGQMAEITLPATKQRFETWSAHPEVGGGADQTDESAPTEIAAAARELLANEEGVDEEAVTLINSEGISWSDASLGCPQEGMSYAQVITPGYILIFLLGDSYYAVHTNADGSNLIVCNGDE